MKTIEILTRGVWDEPAVTGHLADADNPSRHPSHQRLPPHPKDLGLLTATFFQDRVHSTDSV